MRQTAAGRRWWLSLLLLALFGVMLVPDARSQAPTTIKYGAPTATPDITTVGVTSRSRTDTSSGRAWTSR